MFYRYLAMANNEAGRTRADDAQASTLSVSRRKKIRLLFYQYFFIIFKQYFFPLASQNLRRAFELRSTMTWNTFSTVVKNGYLTMTNLNMDMAKDVSFLDWLDMPLKKKVM